MTCALASKHVDDVLHRSAPIWIERVFGTRRYLMYYFVCVVSAALTQLAFSALSGGIYPTVGASGGVFVLLLAFSLYFSNNRVMLLFPPIPMPARTFVLFYAAIELFLGVTVRPMAYPTSPTSSEMIGGFALLRYWHGPFGGSRIAR